MPLNRKTTEATDAEARRAQTAEPNVPFLDAKNHRKQKSYRYKGYRRRSTPCRNHRCKSHRDGSYPNSAPCKWGVSDGGVCESPTGPPDGSPLSPPQPDISYDAIKCRIDWRIACIVSKRRNGKNPTQRLIVTWDRQSQTSQRQPANS